MNLLRLTGAGLALLLILAGPRLSGVRADDDDESPLVGKPAPDLEGDFGINGKAVRLSDLKGKIVVLDFWAVWCGPCIATFPHLRELHKEFKDQGVVVLGVTKYYSRYGFDTETGKLKQVGKVTKDPDTGKIKVEGGLTPEKERSMLEDFARHHKLPYHLMALPSDAASKAYGVRGIPTVVVIDRKGIVRMVRVGSNEENAEAIKGEIKKLVEQK